MAQSLHRIRRDLATTDTRHNSIYDAMCQQCVYTVIIEVAGLMSCVVSSKEVTVVTLR